jgi:RNA recognition motif-containing protein
MLRTLIANSRRTFASKVYVQGLPVEWDFTEIKQRFGSVGPVTYVHLIKNSIGQNSGKAILTFEKDESGEQAIARFDNQAVDNLICRVRPFLEK